MCLVTDNQVPTAFGNFEFMLHILIARELIEPGDDEVIFKKPVPGTCSFELVIGQNFKVKLESAVKLVLPLLSQAARADDETTLQIAAGDQFLDEQPGHDG